MADGPTSTPSASPTPLPTPARTSSASLSPADATLGVTASPAATSPSPSPAVPSPTPDPEAARAAAEAARVRDAALLANARSLAQVIEAQARVAQDELAGLDPQIAQVAKDLDVVNADAAELQAKFDARRALHGRLERDTFRFAAIPPDQVPMDLTEGQREALDELLSLRDGLLAAQTKLAERADVLATLRSSVGVKQAQLARMRDRARILAAAAAAGDTQAKEAQILVLKSLAQDATNAQTALAQLVASAMVRDGTAAAWSLPLRGVHTVIRPDDAGARATSYL